MLGCFGLSNRITERDLYDLFEKYGKIENIVLIINRKSGISKGYGFVYFDKLESAKKAKHLCTGKVLDGRSIRIDYSLSKKPHSPTPGMYYGHNKSRTNRYSVG